MKNQYILVLLVAVLLGGCNNGLPELLDREGNSYSTKKYGETIWMTENLYVTKDKFGNAIKYYHPNNDSAQTPDFGLLYNYETACNICPDGWQLPANEDWEALFNLTDSNIAGNFKDSRYWENEANNNSSSFSARPAGYGNNEEHNNHFKSKAIFWSVTKEDSHFAWSFILEKGSDSIRMASQHPTYAFSVRCIQSKTD